MVEGAARLVLVVNLGHHEGLLQGALDLNAEPVLDAAGDELDGDEEQDDGGHESQGNEGQDQLGFQLGPQDLLLPLEDQLDHVPQDEEHQEEKEEDVEANEGDDQDIAGHRDLVGQLGDVSLKKEKQPDERQENENYDDLPPFPFRGLVLPLILSHMRILDDSRLLFFRRFVSFFKSFNILPDISGKSKERSGKGTRRYEK
jgi:hypothetical protein